MADGKSDNPVSFVKTNRPLAMSYADRNQRARIQNEDALSPVRHKPQVLCNTCTLRPIIHVYSNSVYIFNCKRSMRSSTNEVNPVSSKPNAVNHFTSGSLEDFEICLDIWEEIHFPNCEQNLLVPLG